MGILDLPSEIFQIILVEAVRIRGVKRALRLRLVNTFSEELVGALVVSNIITVGYLNVSISIWTWIRPYFERRLRERRTKGLPRLHTIRKIAERLAAEEGADSSYDAYALHLLQLVSNSGDRIRQLFSSSLPRETKEFQSALLVAVVLTKHASFATMLANFQLDLTNDTPFGRLEEAAVRARNYPALTLLFFRKNFGARVLKLASNNGDIQMVKYMLDLKDNSVNPWYGYTPHTIERREISRGAKSAYLRTPSVEIFETILVELQSRRLATLDDILLRWLPLSAAQDGWTDMVKHLILRGALVDRPKHMWRETPLWRACKKGREEVVQILLDNGAQPCGLEFEVAAAHGHVSTMKVLLGSEAAANPLSTKDCLYAAARKGFVSVVQLMLDFGVDPNNGDTAPLIGAMESEHTTIFWMLVQRGALASKILPEAHRRAEAQGLESMLALLHEAQ